MFKNDEKTFKFFQKKYFSNEHFSRHVESSYENPVKKTPTKSQETFDHGPKMKNQSKI